MINVNQEKSKEGLKNRLGDPHVVEGQLITITNIQYEYMDERIFSRQSVKLDSTNLGVLVDGTIHTVMFPGTIDYNTGIDIMNQKIRYTHCISKINNPEDYMEGSYKTNKFSLEILSGVRKDQKYNRKFIS